VNGAVEILAAGLVVQSLAAYGAALTFGLAVRKQLRIAAPPRQQAQPATAAVEDLSKRRTG
jgi:hypothetical protein